MAAETVAVASSPPSELGPALRLTEHVQAIAPFLPLALVSRHALLRIEALPAALPDRLPKMRHSMIECRLSRNPSDARTQRAVHEQVDLAWKIAPEELAGFEGIPGETWEALARFGRAWAAAGSSDPIREVYLAGLELDLDRSPNHGILPAVFFCFGRCDAGTTFAILEALLESFGGRSPGIGAACRRCIEALPSGAGVNYAGLMLSRRSDALRLGVEHVLPLDRILPYLDAIGWKGSRASLAGFFDSLPEVLASCAPVLAMDVGQHVERRLGIELLLAHPEALRNNRLQRLLDHLVKLRLCAPRERDAILRWPSGRWAAQSPLAAAQGNPSWCDRFLEVGRRHPERFVSHVKLVCTARGGLEAKCYLEATS